VRDNEVDPDRLLLCPLCPQVCAKADRQQAAHFLPFRHSSTANTWSSVGISNLFSIASPSIAFRATAASRPIPSHSGNRRAHLKAVTYSDLRQWQSGCRKRQALPAIQPIFLLRCSRRSGISRRHRIHPVSGAWPSDQTL